MGSKFLINYLRQKWCQMPELYVAVNLYWECRNAYPVQLWTNILANHEQSVHAKIIEFVHCSDNIL